MCMRHREHPYQGGKLVGPRLAGDGVQAGDCIVDHHPCGALRYVLGGRHQGQGGGGRHRAGPGGCSRASDAARAQHVACKQAQQQPRGEGSAQGGAAGSWEAGSHGQEGTRGGDL
jgi:hypothetical protein